jgi:membrane protease YdiL (CAAX protease family)
VLQALKQAWWAPVAGLLVLAQLLLTVSFAVGGNDADEAIVGVTIALGGALLLAAGLWRRPTARGLGNALIILGAALAAFFFWSLVMPFGAIIVVVGVATSELRSPAPAAQAP